MSKQAIGIIMNGVTGRMGTNQHLIRSIVAIRQQGGVSLKNGDTLVPEPILVGRNAQKLEALAARVGVTRFSTNLAECLASPEFQIYFDSSVTSEHAAGIEAALAAGKHVYSEKPLAPDVATAMRLAKAARDAGLKNGIVQDKLFLPGIRKLKRLIDGGFFGKILSVRGEFGYWVFEGDWQPAQRPSWNYRKEDGGGIILDMFCHWEYVLGGTVGRVKNMSALGATHIEERFDEAGKPYRCTADDAAYGTFPAGKRRDCADEFVLGCTRESGRAICVAGGRYTRHRSCRIARLQSAASGEYAEGGLEPRYCESFRFSRSVGDGARQRRVRQRIQVSVGNVPAACGGRRAIPA